MTKKLLSFLTFVLLAMTSMAQETNLVIDPELPVTFDSWSANFLIQKTDVSAGDQFVFYGESIDVEDWEYGPQVLPKNNGDWSDLGGGIALEDGKAIFHVTENYAEIINNNGGLRVQGMACIINSVEFVKGEGEEVLVITPELPVTFDSWSANFLIQKTDVEVGGKFIFSGEAIDVEDWEYGPQVLPKNNGDWSNLGDALVLEDGTATFLITEEFAEIINSNGGLRVQGMACVINGVEYVAPEDIEEEDKEDLAITYTDYPWNYSYSNITAANILYDSQWGEFAIASGIPTGEYKGIKIEYVGDPSSVVDGNYMQFKAVAGASEQYVNISANNQTATIYFNDDLNTVGTVDYVNLQAMNSDVFFTITKAYLIKSNDELEPIENLDRSGWGYSFTLPSNNISFEGQWGSLTVVDKYGGDITFEPGTGAQAYKYVVELDEENAPTNTFTIELNDGENGFAWNNFEAGTTKCEVVVDDEACGTNTMQKLYIKANAAEGYPFNFDIKRIYRVPIESEAVLGDVNGDGTIDVNDIMCVAEYILGQDPANFIFENADMDASGDVNVTDISMIVNIILGTEE